MTGSELIVSLAMVIIIIIVCVFIGTTRMCAQSPTPWCGGTGLDGRERLTGWQ